MGSGTLRITLPRPPGPRAALLLLTNGSSLLGPPLGNSQALSPTAPPLPLDGGHEQRREFRAVIVELPVSHIACTGTSAALGRGSGCVSDGLFTLNSCAHVAFSHHHLISSFPHPHRVVLSCPDEEGEPPNEVVCSGSHGRKSLCWFKPRSV